MVIDLVTTVHDLVLLAEPRGLLSEPANEKAPKRGIASGQVWHFGGVVSDTELCHTFGSRRVACETFAVRLCQLKLADRPHEIEPQRPVQGNCCPMHSVVAPAARQHLQGHSATQPLGVRATRRPL